MRRRARTVLNCTTAFLSLLRQVLQQQKLIKEKQDQLSLVNMILDAPPNTVNTGALQFFDCRGHTTEMTR